MLLGHEIAHNILEHSKTALIKYAIDETNKELKKDIKSIEKLEYGKITALNNLLLPRIMESKNESREHETGADSLGAVFVMNAGYNIENAIQLFSLMSDSIVKNPDMNPFYNLFPTPVKDLFISKSKQYSHTSSLAGIKANIDSIAGYLRTHPYGPVRYLTLAKKYNLPKEFKSTFPANSQLDLIHANLNEISFKYLTTNKQYSEAFFNMMRYAISKSKSLDSVQVAGLFANISFLKERRQFGAYVDLQDPEQDEDYDRICALLESLTPDESKFISRTIYPKQTEIKNPKNTSEHMMLLLYLTKTENKESLKTHYLKHYEELKKSNYSSVLSVLEDYLLNVKALLKYFLFC